MTLKRIDQDIPSALVEKYNSNKAAYADEGKTACLPLLIFGNEHLAKTAAGFQAYKDGSMGIGLIIHSVEKADFDPKGRLLKHESKGSLLTGLLLSEKTGKAMKNDVVLKSYARSTLWGALGYSSEMDGAKKLSVLWIPIPLSRGK